jgi:hypothetical protein
LDKKNQILIVKKLIAQILGVKSKLKKIPKNLNQLLSSTKNQIDSLSLKQEKLNQLKSLTNNFKITKSKLLDKKKILSCLEKTQKNVDIQTKVIKKLETLKTNLGELSSIKILQIDFETVLKKAKLNYHELIKLNGVKEEIEDLIVAITSKDKALKNQTDNYEEEQENYRLLLTQLEYCPNCGEKLSVAGKKKLLN